MTFLTLLSGALGVALGALGFWIARSWIRAKPAPLDEGHNPADIVFLIEDGEVVDESASGKLLLEAESVPIMWPDLVDLLSARFPSFPQSFDDASLAAPSHISPQSAEDIGSVHISHTEYRLRVEVRQSACAALGARHHLAQIDQISLKMLTRTVGHAPYPVWITDDSNHLLWHNPAYDHMKALTPKDQDAFDPLTLDFTSSKSHRVCLSSGPEDFENWYEVSRAQVDNLTAYYATDISQLVRAERAQRGFVQTLTKTFANLGTGLAIFDRHHRLVLFNPALIELTQMSAEFLTSRPSLTAFFDWLRDNRVMPEPRDYAEWRTKLRNLTKEAAEGTFSELWSLPNGLSFRVLGRPQTDGAIAFLFEDVTAELSLTRNFVKELEINTALLDRLPQAIAIFAPTGDILTVNAQYQTLWNNDPNSSIALVDVTSAIAIWSKCCQPTDVWEDVAKALNASSGNNASVGQIPLLDGTLLDYTVEKLGKGASAILFEPQLATVSEKDAVPA